MAGTIISNLVVSDIHHLLLSSFQATYGQVGLPTRRKYAVHPDGDNLAEAFEM